MSDHDLLRRLEILERDNVRLRRLLDGRGTTAGLRHETRNTLAMVRDVVRRSAETSGSVEDYAAHLEGRLDAVIRIQTAIANRLQDGVSLHGLVADELTVPAIGTRERLAIEGPDFLLQPAAAGPLGLAFHELATNAVKFGTLASPAARIDVTWAVTESEGDRPCLALDWVESGAPVPPRPARRGFGTEVIEHMVPYQLGGHGALAFAPDGIRCSLRLPMTPALGQLRPPPRDAEAGAPA